MEKPQTNKPAVLLLAAPYPDLDALASLPARKRAVHRPLPIGTLLAMLPPTDRADLGRFGLTHAAVKIHGVSVSVQS